MMLTALTLFLLSAEPTAQPVPAAAAPASTAPKSKADAPTEARPIPAPNAK